MNVLSSRSLVALVLLAPLASACGGSQSASSGAGGGASSSSSGASTTSSGASSTSTSSSGQGGATSSSSSSGSSTSSSGSSSGLAGPSVADFVGVNAFVNDPTDVVAAFGPIREYHDWEWNHTYWDGQGQHQTTAEQPIFQGADSTWSFDDVYQAWHAKGATIFPCIEGSIPAVGGGSYSQNKPVSPGADTKDPASYVEHAKYLYQYAARYGATKVDAAKLSVGPMQQAISGLGYVSGLEDWNEEENTWAPKGAQFTAEEYAAMASADYDGHKGALGPNAGVKTADPGMLFLMGGLAGTGPSDWLTNVTNYLCGIKAWSDANRGGSFPADVLNVHLYCMDYNAMHASSPEDCKLQGTIQKLVQWRDANLPGKPLWVTEFGYDVNPGSWNKAIAIGPNDIETVQAQWIVRAYLALLLAGADKADLFMTRDNGGDSVFSSPGVVTETFNKGNVVADSYSPRPAFYWLSTMRTRLGAMHLDQEQASGDPDVRVVRFKDAGGKHAYAIWRATSQAATTSGYALDVGAAASLTKVELQTGQMNGAASPLAAQGGKAAMDVTETPVLVLED